MLFRNALAFYSFTDGAAIDTPAVGGGYVPLWRRRRR